MKPSDLMHLLDDGVSMSHAYWMCNSFLRFRPTWKGFTLAALNEAFRQALPAHTPHLTPATHRHMARYMARYMVMYM